MSETLQLTLTRDWFLLMLSGKKKIEIRKPSEWIKSRLDNRNYRSIRFINGYGKDYINNSLLYEGNWENNMKNGHGSLYYLESNIIYYKGYFNNNKKNGSGKLYYKNGNLKIDGFWEDDLLINGLEY